LVIDFTVLSAWAAAIGVIVAIVALAVQVRQAGFNSSLDSLWHLEQRFNDLENKRSVAAKFLQRGLKNEPGWHPDEAPDELFEVLDFFSLLGYLVSAGAIREEAAWMRFSSWAFAYWVAARDCVAKRREQNPLYWRHYEQLFNQMERTEIGQLLIFDDRLPRLAWMPRGLRRIVSAGAGFVSLDWIINRQADEIKGRIDEEASRGNASPITFQSQPPS
jgi:hypothetical protein